MLMPLPPAWGEAGEPVEDGVVWCWYGVSVWCGVGVGVLILSVGVCVLCGDAMCGGLCERVIWKDGMKCCWRRYC